MVTARLIKLLITMLCCNKRSLMIRWNFQHMWVLEARIEFAVILKHLKMISIAFRVVSDSHRMFFNIFLLGLLNALFQGFLDLWKLIEDSIRFWKIFSINSETFQDPLCFGNSLETFSIFFGDYQKFFKTFGFVKIPSR